jgi:exodeoxyribonuclease V alpha subunit
VTWQLHHVERGHEDGCAALAATIVDMIVTAPEPLQPFGRELSFDWDVQVLAPMRKGPMGTYALNVHLQRLRVRLLGNPDPDPTEENKPPRPLVGDRVIWTKNDYELDLYNGTQAIVLGFAKGGAMELFTEDGREVTIPAAKRIHAEVSYAMTIHKSQGSEWPFVLLVASSAHWHMHDRNLLYTGASRASESLMILGDRPGLAHFAAERKSEARQTFGAFLMHGWEPAMRLPQAVVEALE